MPHPPKPPVDSHSRAGRNLPAAIVTALILLAIVAVSLIFYIEIFVALVAVAVVLAIWEFSGAIISRNFQISFFAFSFASIAMVIITWFCGIGAGFLTYLLAVSVNLGITKYYLRENLQSGIVGAFGLAWICLSAIFAVEMAHFPNPGAVIAALVLLPVANDTGGWCAGVLFGKHPMLPKISPKKSWEGFLGSLALAILIAYLTVGLLVGLNWQWVLLFGIATPFIATAGDFAESLVKRDLGIKDMGSIFPGHGGILDRVDSILFCAPGFYFFFALAFGAI